MPLGIPKAPTTSAVGGAAGTAGNAAAVGAGAASGAANTGIQAAGNIAQGNAALASANAEAENAMNNMNQLTAIQNKVALGKGVNELGKEVAKAQSTFTADSGKAATAQ